MLGKFLLLNWIAFTQIAAYSPPAPQAPSDKMAYRYPSFCRDIKKESAVSPITKIILACMPRLRNRDDVPTSTQVISPPFMHRDARRSLFFRAPGNLTVRSPGAMNVSRHAPRNQIPTVENARTRDRLSFLVMLVRVVKPDPK